MLTFDVIFLGGYITMLALAFGLYAVVMIDITTDLREANKAQKKAKEAIEESKKVREEANRRFYNKD